MDSLKTTPLLLVVALIICVNAFAQKRVAITIDDIPQKLAFSPAIYQQDLLTALDLLNIPITIFVNGKSIYDKTAGDGVGLINQWIKRPYITVGDHSYSHQYYSKVGFNNFSRDVSKNAGILKKLTKPAKKDVQFFRFPFNDLGADSVQQVRMEHFLKGKGYIIAPYTIESGDWMYNYLYEYYLHKKDLDSAAEIGLKYINKTLWAFEYFEKLSYSLYSRELPQIYLCHDNLLNAKYLPEIIIRLKHKGCHFISLQEAINDKVYQQENRYYEKWGISWLYRWMGKKAYTSLMKTNPDDYDDGAYKIYARLTQQ